MCGSRHDAYNIKIQTAKIVLSKNDSVFIYIGELLYIFVYLIDTNVNELMKHIFPWFISIEKPSVLFTIQNILNL